MRLSLITTAILAGFASGWEANKEIAPASSLFDSKRLPSFPFNQTDGAVYVKPILFEDFQPNKTLDAYQFEALKNISTILINKQTQIVEKHKMHAANITQIVNKIEIFNGIVKGLGFTHSNKNNFARKVEEYKMLMKQSLILLEHQKSDVDEALALEEKILENAKYLSSTEPPQEDYDDIKKGLERVVGRLEGELENISELMGERTLDSSRLIEIIKTETESLVAQSKQIEIEYLVSQRSKEF